MYKDMFDIPADADKEFVQRIAPGCHIREDIFVRDGVEIRRIYYLNNEDKNSLKNSFPNIRQLGEKSSMQV